MMPMCWMPIRSCLSKRGIMSVPVIIRLMRGSRCRKTGRIVLSDVCMPGCSGIDLMTLFHQDDDLLPILLITGHGDVPMAVEAVKKGTDFLQKPIDPGKLLTLVDAALRQRQSVIARRQYCQQNYRLSLLAAANGRFGIASAFSSWQKRILRYGFTASREPAA